MSHHYLVKLVWTGNRGTGTSGYRAYDRDHQIIVRGKPVLKVSADAAFRGDPHSHNPEDLLVAALASCHMLWYLHLAAEAGIVVTGYRDEADGDMESGPEGGRFLEVILKPTVTIQAGDPAVALALHGEANRRCFIANSVNFPVKHAPTILQAG
ncbi:MAG: OsmC family peroxiredoxin [Geminicoccaceae bacterium]|nr:MAG: OsmC family peroxiredoxin [Geminicoccaceae bacterium]